MKAKKTLRVRLMMALFNSEFEKLSLAEMQELRNVAAEKCKRKEQALRAKPAKGRSSKTAVKSRSIEAIRKQAV